MENDLGRVKTDFNMMSSRVQFHQCSMSSFYARRSQNRKKTVKSSSFFVLSGSASIKAAHRTLMKLTPDFLRALLTAFDYPEIKYLIE